MTPVNRSFWLGVFVALLMTTLIIAYSGTVNVKAHSTYILGATIVSIVIIVMLISTWPIRSNYAENYGGPIKNIKRIPFNNCQLICNGYYKKCMDEYGGNDAGWCAEQFSDACVGECKYTDYHRL
jgi:hypothetical protein